MPTLFHASCLFPKILLTRAKDTGHHHLSHLCKASKRKEDGGIEFTPLGPQEAQFHMCPVFPTKLLF